MNKRLSIQITIDQHKELIAKTEAKGISIAEFMRQAIVNFKPKSIKKIVKKVDAKVAKKTTKKVVKKVAKKVTKKAVKKAVKKVSKKK